MYALAYIYRLLYVKGKTHMSAVYANSSNQVAALKELYTDDKDYMKDAN